MLFTDAKSAASPFARIIISLTEDFGYATIDQLLATEHKPSDLPQFMRIIDAWMDAMERVIGAPAGCLQRPSFDELSQWLPPTSAKKEEANGSTIVSFSSTV